MWMVNPGVMRNQHMPGEHVELHIIIGTVKRNKSISGYLNGHAQLGLIIARHAQLVDEMECRHMNNQSVIELVGTQVYYLAKEISEIDSTQILPP